MEKGMGGSVVCVTGGTGFVASWLVMRLLQHGYSVNTTVRSHPDQKKDVSYLTNLPGASERLRIFNADLDKPESFNDSIQGCVGVFHVAHTINFEGKEDEETNTRRSINATLSILQACLDSKTVKRVVYTSSVSAVMFSGKDSSVLDETLWTDAEFVRSLKTSAGKYYISKTLTERAALEFAEKHGLDLVTVIPTFIHGPFITPHCPDSVRASMSLIYGDEFVLEFSTCISMVHMDDVATAHIFLFEYPNARGRYICSAVDITIDELQIFLSERYPEYNVSAARMEKDMKKGVVCVTGGTGYVASWLIMRLLQQGYAVNTTIRSHPNKKKDVSYLTNLPGASERLRIFNADLDEPESFNDSIQGCVGVFHVAHTIDFEGKDVETNTKRSINATMSILQACLDSKTVKRVVYTSSASAVTFSGKDSSVLDETSWTDVEFVRSLKTTWGPYFISKTLTERGALEFAETHGLDLVTVIPTFIHGPFITPRCPGSVRTSMSVIFGDVNRLEFPTCISFVHMDDVATAHIFLFEYTNARGRYICSAVDITVDELQTFLSERYPEYDVSSTSSLKLKDSKELRVSSQKLLDTGFEYKYGLEQMYDDAIGCCKQKGLL